MLTTYLLQRVVRTIGVLAVAAALAACTVGAGAPPATPPATPPPASPPPAETPAPTGVPAPNLQADLESASGKDVTIDILDRTRSVTGATSGTPGDGMTVEPGAIRIEDVDSRTLRLTWTDFPIDNDLQLFVDPAGTGLRFVLIQPAPSGPTDAMGEERILELTFDRDVSAAGVEAILQADVDTPG